MLQIIHFSFRDMHRFECGENYVGLCENMTSINGETLLKFLRNVSFTGEWFFTITPIPYITRTWLTGSDLLNVLHVNCERTSAVPRSEFLRRPKKFDEIAHLILRLLSKMQINKKILSTFGAFLENIIFKKKTISLNTTTFSQTLK